MEDVNEIYSKFQKSIEDRNRITAIIDKLLSKHELIFVEISNNPIDEKINKAINERRDFCARINASESLKKNMNLLRYDMEDYILCLNLHGLESKIKPLDIPFEELTFNSACISNIVRVVKNIKEEIDIEEEELLVYAYLLAVADINQRIHVVTNKEFAGIDENTPIPIVILRLGKWVVGNKWKEIKRLLLNDAYIKEVCKQFKDGYKRDLKLKRYIAK